MKIGKTRKTSPKPFTAEKPKKVTLKKKVTAISAVVARTRKANRRVEPAPQPTVKDARKSAGKSVVGKGRKKRAKAAVFEPKPQPRVARAKRNNASRISTRGVEEKKAMPAPIIKSAMKEAAATPGISPAAIRPEMAPAMPEHVNSPATKSSPPDVATTSPLISAAPVVRPSVGGPPPVPKPRVVRQPRPVPVEIPAILLEPDHVSNEPAIAGPGARFSLTPPMEHRADGAPDELPESYGTQQIFLAARDPYCLFASWDLDGSQRARYNAASASGALTIRLRRDFVEGPIELEVHTLPNSRDRFIEVTHPDATFVAELGYHEKSSGAWKRISISKPVTTPRDRMAPLIVTPTPAPSVTTEAPVGPPSEPEPRAVAPEPRYEWQSRNEEIVFAIQAPQARQQPDRHREPPSWHPPTEQPRWKPAPPVKWKPKIVPAPKWSAVKARALDELISLEFRRMQQGSLEIEEVLRRRILRPGEELEEAPSSLELAEEWEAEEMVSEALGLAQPPSSLDLAERPGAAKGFWFKVNAELIIYGSTEPDAHVSIGGRPIRLRSDGSFSYRFALPDGAYELPVVAIAQDGHDGRAAELRFSRATRYSGEVGAHPQDEALKPPSPANL